MNNEAKRKAEDIKTQFIGAASTGKETLQYELIPEGSASIDHVNHLSERIREDLLAEGFTKDNVFFGMNTESKKWIFVITVPS